MPRLSAPALTKRVHEIETLFVTFGQRLAQFVHELDVVSSRLDDLERRFRVVVPNLEQEALMPEDYEKIKQALRKQHPDWSDDKLKESAARITNSKRKAAGRPPAKFHAYKKK